MNVVYAHLKKKLEEMGEKELDAYHAGIAAAYAAERLDHHPKDKQRIGNQQIAAYRRFMERLSIHPVIGTRVNAAGLRWSASLEAFTKEHVRAMCDGNEIVREMRRKGKST